MTFPLDYKVTSRILQTLLPILEGSCFTSDRDNCNDKQFVLNLYHNVTGVTSNFLAFDLAPTSKVVALFFQPVKASHSVEGNGYNLLQVTFAAPVSLYGWKL